MGLRWDDRPPGATRRNALAPPGPQAGSPWLSVHGAQAHDGCHAEPTTHLTTGHSGGFINSAQRRNEGGSQVTVSGTRSSLWALGGVLFAAFFIGGDFLGGALANGALPLPGAPVGEVVRYITGSRAAVLVVGVAQVLSALSLFVFVAPVAALVRRVTGGRGTLVGLASGAGVLSAVLLFVCALLGLVMVPVAAGDNLALVDVLRQANFLTGGTLHVATLGLFVGATSIAARGAKALPSWICWLGIVQATLAVLSLASLLFFPAALLILLGRMLGFVWCVCVGLVLALRAGRGTVAGV
jgi:hypothetical protein